MNMQYKIRKEITIKEYGIIWTEENEWFWYWYKKVDQVTFNELETFVLSEKNQNENIFGLANKKGLWKVITIQNYVWVLQTKSGTVIEVLPKIANIENEEITRRIFLRMLKTLKDSPFKNLNDATLRNQNFPILEIFIQLFLSELSLLVKKWIKKNYVEKDDNLKYIKGKLNIKKNLTLNLFDHSKFYCEFDEFLEDTKENRLIKTCLLKISHISKNPKNLWDIKIFLHYFSWVGLSKDIKSDLKLIDTINRLHTYYLPTLKWVKLFLWNESVVNFKWDTLALSLLFPMEKIFESYVAHVLKKKFPHHQISSQDTWKYLVEEHKESKKFKLRPDIVIDEGLIVADTKWKIVNANDYYGNYWISQSDMYQLYAYAKKYHCNELYLIYPQNENFQEMLPEFKYEDNVSLTAIPYDLEGDDCLLFDRL